MLRCRAMGGTMKFEDSLAARLNMMQPSKQQITQFLQDHPPRISKGSALHFNTFLLVPANAPVWKAGPCNLTQVP